MKKTCSVVFVLIFTICNYLFSDEVDVKKIQTIINVFQTHDKNKIIDLFILPFDCGYPIPKIADKKALFDRFDEIIDDEIILLVSFSSAADWSVVGWRGIMLKNGIIWLNDDYKIIAINYQTKKRKLKIEQMIQDDKKTLPAKLRQFDYPEGKWLVNNTLYRVDKIDDTYRLLIINYSNQRIISELYSGNLLPDGSGGNHYYEWNDNAGISTIIYVDVLGGDTYYVVKEDGTEKNLQVLEDELR